MNLRVRIGGERLVAAETDANGWRLIVRGSIRGVGVDPADLHDALRELALSDRDLGHNAFEVVMNCAGSWEDDYTEARGETTLSFEDWRERIESGLVHWVDDDGELQTGE